MRPKVLCSLLALVLCCILVTFGIAEGNTENTAEDTVETVAEEIVELKNGSKGQSVSDLQTRLKELGYYSKSIDGDFSNGTKQAVMQFQSRNNLEADGIATVETIQAIYSDDAVPAPKLPSVLVTKVSFGSTTKVTVTNNLDVTVDEVSIRVFPYDENGEVFLTLSSGDADYYTLACPFPINKKIAPGKSQTFALDTSNIACYNVKTASACITQYHTSDGFRYDFAANQLYFMHSDGTVQYQEDESDPNSMSDEDIEKSLEVSFGITTGTIYPWISDAYAKHAGDILLDVESESTFDRAGLKKNDILLAFDEETISGENTYDRAKLRMLGGEQVVVHYWRSNQECTTTIALNMDEVTSPNTATDGTSLVDQLAQLSELYQKGLLSEEEYNAAKASLLNTENNASE